MKTQSADDGSNSSASTADRVGDGSWVMRGVPEQPLLVRPYSELLRATLDILQSMHGSSLLSCLPTLFQLSFEGSISQHLVCLQVYSRHAFKNLMAFSLTLMARYFKYQCLITDYFCYRSTLYIVKLTFVFPDLSVVI